MSNLGFPVLVLGVSCLVGLVAVTAACSLRRHQKRQNTKSAPVQKTKVVSGTVSNGDHGRSEAMGTQMRSSIDPIMTETKETPTHLYLGRDGHNNGCWCAPEDMYCSCSAMSCSTMRSASDYYYSSALVRTPCVHSYCPSSCDSHW